MNPLLRSLRPNQWAKNLVVPAAFVFALGVREASVTLADILPVIWATLVFCALSSSIYLINDVHDLEQDRDHPVKRNRPIAAGSLSVRTAVATSICLMAGGLGCAWYLGRPFFWTAAGYTGLQILYTFVLKRVALLDVFVIASGFVLRALAGAVVIAVPISHWLLLCAFLLALFLGLCKRRHEKVVLEAVASTTRPSLQQYDEKLLDQLIAIICAATIVSYALYTFWPDTVEKFGTHGLGFTIPFVILGMFRYLDLVYRHDRGGRPEQILLTDLPLFCILAAYGTTVALLLFVF